MEILKKYTEQKYVDKIHKNQNGLKKYQWLWLVFFVGMIGALFAWLALFDKLVNGFNRGEKYYYNYIGLVGGVAFGFIATGIGNKALMYIKRWVTLKSGISSEALMLKYHDKLKENGLLNDEKKII